MNLVELVEEERRKLESSANTKKDIIKHAYENLKGFSDVKLSNGQNVQVTCDDYGVALCYNVTWKEGMFSIEKQERVFCFSVTYDMLKQVYVLDGRDEVNSISQVQQRAAEVLARKIIKGF